MVWGLARDERDRNGVCMNTYFVTDQDEGYEGISFIVAETAEAAAAAFADNMGFGPYDLEFTTLRVFEPKANVKTYRFDIAPHVVEVKASKGAK